jgi:hypothetical protein
MLQHVIGPIETADEQQSTGLTQLIDDPLTLAGVLEHTDPICTWQTLPPSHLFISGLRRSRVNAVILGRQSRTAPGHRRDS